MRRSILLGVVLATAALFVVPTESQAQGFGFRIGNVGVGIGRPYYGGWGYGGYGYGYGYPYYGSSYYGSPYYSSYNYGWMPGYSRWYYPSTYYGYSYPSTSIDYYASSPTTTTTQSFYQGAQQPANQASETAAYVRISVPENAKVFFQDQATTQTGADRLFYSPPLTPGREFIYNVKATWTDANGKEVSQTRQVRIHAGDLVNIDLRSGSDSTSAYQPADNTKPAPADNSNPNANYRGAPVIERGEPGTTPPNTTTLQQPIQQVPARQPATTNTTNVIVPSVIGGVGPAPAVGNVPAGSTVTPGSNVPNTVPSGTTSTPGASNTPTGTAPIGPVIPNAPTSTPIAPAAPPTNR